MRMYDDTGLSGRFAALEPEPRPGNWDEVLDRAGMARDARQRLERSRPVRGRRRRLVVVLAGLVLATAATTAGWAIVHEVVLHKGFIGLPPVGATPSAPESGELVIQYSFDQEDMQPKGGGRGWVYADGRLITLREKSDLPEAANHWLSGFLEQRLTPEGVELLRSEIVATGLFEHHQPAGRWSSPHNVIQVRIGDRLIRAQAKGAAASDEFPKRLRERLAFPESWLPASAWEDKQIRAYVASRYAIYHGGQFQTIKRSRLLSLLPEPAADLLRAREAVPQHGFNPKQVTRYVSDLTTEEARALARALDDAGLREKTPQAALGYLFEIPGTSVDLPPPWGRVRNAVFIAFEPYLPHGESICSLCG